MKNVYASLFLGAVIPLFFVALSSGSFNFNISFIEKHEPYTEKVGVITKLNCENHGAYYVGYKVNGVSLNNVPGYHGDECRHGIKVNTSIPVWVSSRDSSYIISVPPEVAKSKLRSMQSRELKSYPYQAIGIFIVSLIVFSIKKRRTK